jgi:two-component system response regulator DevR
VLIADPLAILRSGARRLLAGELDLEVSEACSLDELLCGAAQGCPDVALIDRDLPPSGGVEAVAALAGRSPCRAIVWSLDPTGDDVLAAVLAGASGYLCKDVSGAELVRSLRAILRAEATLPPRLATLLVDELQGRERREHDRLRAALLSGRERQVLGLASGGATNRQIAGALAISEYTVKRHMQNIFGKLELPSRRAAGAFYRSAFDAEPDAHAGSMA